MSDAISLLAGTPQKFERSTEPSRPLWAITSRWDTEFRHQPEERFHELQQKAAELRMQFPSPSDQAHIMFQVAHVAAQSGISKHIERVRNNGLYVLTNSRDPLERATVYSYLGSAEEVDESVKSFPEQRRRAAAILLSGYAELLGQHLPAKAPPLPELNIRGDRNESDPFAAAQAQQLRLQQVKAQEEARYMGELVKQRDALATQLRSLYRPALNVPGRNADGPDELRALAEKKLPNQEAVETLLTRVTGPEKIREEGKWVVQGVKADLAQLAVGTREGLKVGDILEVLSLDEKPVRIGLLRIVAVDEKESVGKLIDQNGLGDPKLAYVVPFKP